MPTDTLRPWRMPPTAVDRTGPVSDLERRNHSTRSPGSDPSGPSASRSASGERSGRSRRPGVAALLATDDQSLRKTGVVVGQDRLEPTPVRGRRLVIEDDQPGCQRVAGHRRPAGAAEPAKVFMDAEKGEGPRPGRGRFKNRRQYLVKCRNSPELEIAAMRPSDTGSEGPERTTVAVLRPDLLPPESVVSKKIAKPSLRRIERVLKKRRIPAGKIGHFIPDPEILEQHSEQEGPRIIVRAIPLGIIRDGENRVLEQPVLVTIREGTTLPVSP